MANAIKRISDGKIIIECSELELMEIITSLSFKRCNITAERVQAALEKLIDELCYTPEQSEQSDR